MRKIAILLVEGFADWEYALVAGTGKPYYGLHVRYFTSCPGQVVSMGGLAAQVTDSLDDMTAWEPTVVVVVGGELWMSEKPPNVQGLLQECYEQGATIAGICGGTLALASAGMLNKVRHTSNNVEFLVANAKEYVGSAYYCHSSTAVAHDRIITAGGPAIVSFSAEVFRAAGISGTTVAEFCSMMAAEHDSLNPTSDFTEASASS